MIPKVCLWIKVCVEMMQVYFSFPFFCPDGKSLILRSVAFREDFPQHALAGCCGPAAASSGVMVVSSWLLTGNVRPDCRWIRHKKKSNNF